MNINEVENESSWKKIQENMTSHSQIYKYSEIVFQKLLRNEEWVKKLSDLFEELFCEETHFVLTTL